MLDALIWPVVMGICLIVLGTIGMLVFRSPVTRLIDRARRIGKEGASFDWPQEGEQPKPPPPTFTDIMSSPVSATVVERETFVKKALGEFDLKTETERTAVLIRAAAISRIEMEYTRIGHTIFGSQMTLLMELTGIPKEVPLERARGIFLQAQQTYLEAHKDRSFDDWLRFMTSWNLVSVQNDTASLTQYGVDFLKFLLDQRLTYQRYG